MISDAPACAKCKRRSIVTFHVDPEEAFVKVTLGRWRTAVWPSCFDQEGGLPAERQERARPHICASLELCAASVIPAFKEEGADVGRKKNRAFGPGGGIRMPDVDRGSGG